MDLLDPNFDADYDIGNDDGVSFGDIFYLNYHGINLFFYVCGLDRHRVRIYELAKKRKVINGIHAEFLTPKLAPTTCPKVVLMKNLWTKSEMWVETTSDGNIIIPVTQVLINMARRNGEPTPVMGNVLAYPLKEELEMGILNYYWPAPSLSRKKLNKIKIMA